MTEILTTVLVASLVGSLHCLGMCGGFVAFYAGAPSRGGSSGRLAAHLAYNGGRLVTYVLLGAAAGALGQSLNLAGSLSGLREGAALVAGTLIVVWGGVLLLQAGGAHWATLPAPAWLSRSLSRVLPRLLDRPPVVRALVLGLSSTLLPCGWLYGFAATAAGSGDPARGALIMAVFWLGTLPALLGSGLGIRALARTLGPRLGVVMPALLIVVGLFTVASRGLGPSLEDALETALEPGEPGASAASPPVDPRPAQASLTLGGGR